MMSDETALPAAAKPPSLARRILFFPLTLMLLAILVFAAGSLIATALLKLLPANRNSPWLFANAAIVILTLAAAFRLFFHYLDREGAGLFDRRGWAKELLAGIAAGTLIFSAVVAVAAALGFYHVAGGSGLDTIWEPLIIAGLIAGFTEELLFRGILFRYVEKAAGSWIALALTAALFGAAHLANPGASWFAAVAIAIEAGLLLGAVYMLTRRLWAVMGLHAAWNFTQGWIFGLPVSGTRGGIGLLNGRLDGPELMTGGAFGLEASLPGMAVATAAGIGVLIVAIRKGRVVAPIWSRPKADAAAGPPGEIPPPGT